MAKNCYEGEFTISTPRKIIKSFDIATPTFEPFPGKNLEFRFETSYREYIPICSLFKLRLVKLSSATIPPILEVSVCVNYSDGSTFTAYPPMFLDDGTNCIHFDDIILFEINSSLLKHHDKMRSRTLNIKCRMTILHQDQTSHSADKEKKSLKCVDVRRNPKPCKCVDVIRNLKSLYEQSVLSDFVFKVGEKSFHAHKNILAAHSPVFMKMMTHDFMESKTNSVTITDATPEIFDLFLRSLYAGKLENMSWDSLKELYYLVDKYDVGFLKVECTVAAISVLSVNLVCEILKLADKYSDCDLKTDAINFAVKHINEIVPREDWKELVKTHPMIGYDVTVNFVPK